MDDSRENQPFPKGEIKGKINNELGLPASLKIKRGNQIISLSVTPKFSDENKEWLIELK